MGIAFVMQGRHIRSPCNAERPHPNAPGYARSDEEVNAIVQAEHGGDDSLPLLPTDRIRTKQFLLEQMQHSMRFFDPARCLDPEGGYFHSTLRTVPCTTARLKFLSPKPGSFSPSPLP